MKQILATILIAIVALFAISHVNYADAGHGWNQVGSSASK